MSDPNKAAFYTSMAKKNGNDGNCVRTDGRQDGFSESTITFQERTEGVISKYTFIKQNSELSV